MARGGQGGVNSPTAGAGGDTNGTGNAGATTPRSVQETDLYRLEGNRLYYLNGYRGLMVFDVSNVDQPKLLGRSPIFGSPVDMIVRNGIATVVVADWYGALDDGSPFYGSIVRGLDATDPTNIRVLGDAKLGGWVRDDRVVGDVIYAVSEDYGYGYGDGWFFGWGGGGPIAGAAADGVTGTTTGSTESVIVSSVSFANQHIASVGTTRFDGYAGVFNVTPDAIMLAHQTGDYTQNQSELVYLDISDPGGAIVQRGAATVQGTVQGWGADNGRWNLDFADGKTAHVIGQRYDQTTGAQGYTLSTVDFSNADAPQLASAFDIASPGWSVTARFDAGRMYLSPQSGWYDGTNTTPFQVYDLTDSAAPHLAGTVQLAGEIWNILPAPQSRIFALGQDYGATDQVTLQYLDVTNPAQPTVLGNAEFGQGWAWTPAAGTFKAFTMDAAKGLVVLPFSGWDYTNDTYNNGLQLIEFTPTSETLAGAAKTRGWVERGIFVGNRLVSLSDLSLSVVDYSTPTAPSVVNELTLARNVITAQPSGSTIAEVSSDWWDNDVSTSEVRVLPIAQAEEAGDVSAAPSVKVDGVGAQVFTNGNLAYVVTSVRTTTPCTGGGTGCYERTQQVQVVDLSNHTATLLGKVQLPADAWDYWGWGWFGCFWYDWWDGGSVVQVGQDALAFRRWEPVFDSAGNYVDANSKLYVVDVSNPNAPAIASTTITTDANAWWGNMKVVGGSTLYTTHYEWVDDPNSTNGWVKYYIDRIDLSDRAHPVIGAQINIPGLLVGGDAGDPNLLYTIDYRWDDQHNTPVNDFDVVHLDGDTATLVSSTELDGWVGNTFVVGATAYMSAESYSWNNADPMTSVQLHAIDLTDPSHPIDRVSNDTTQGWGWLLDVEGDRALVTSGWSNGGLDVYRLRAGQAPVYEQTVRTRGWWINGVSRQGTDLYLSSGYWGVQKVHLQ